MTHQPQPKRNRGRRAMQPSPFWSHLQYDTAGSDHESMSNMNDPLLSGSSHHRQQHQYHYTNQPRQSLIPWSPGQTLASDAPPAGMSSFAPVHHVAERLHDDEDEETTTRLGGCCRCCYGSTRHDEHDRRRRRNSGGTKSFCMKIAHLLVSLATFAVLYHVSDKCHEQSWTMNAGESRHVATAGFLTDSVQIISQSISPSSSNTDDDYDNGNQTLNSHKGNKVNNNTDTTVSRGMAVYAVGSPHCPTLTGPPVIIDAPSQTLELMHNAFEYQYFYLNEASNMHVTVHQKRGATNILVLRGSKVLARIQNKRKSPSHHTTHPSITMSDLELAFTTDQIIFERFSYQENAPIEFSFTSPSSDVYVLLYDNAAMNEAATLNVKYHMTLTTYNLEGLVPWCSHLSPVSTDDDTDEVASFTCPPLEVAKAGCIIVEAVEKHSGNSNNETYVSVGERIVDVRIYATRNWIYIGVMSLLPMLVLALVLHCRKKGRNRRRRRFWQERSYQRIPQSQRNRSGGPPQEERPMPNFQYLPPYQQHEGGEEGIASSSSEEVGNVNVDETSPNSRGVSSEESHQRTAMVTAENVVLVNE